MHGCVDANAVNQTHPDTFTHIQHDVSLWFSFVVHPTSSNKHHCEEHHRHNIIISAQNTVCTKSLYFGCVYRAFKLFRPTKSNHH